jgi:hypothetical protein
MSRSRRRRDQDRRGEHKKAASRETRKWNAEHLLPERPGWMSKEQYEQLAKLRGQL